MLLIFIGLVITLLVLEKFQKLINQLSGLYTTCGHIVGQSIIVLRIDI